MPSYPKFIQVLYCMVSRFPSRVNSGFGPSGHRTPLALKCTTCWKRFGATWTERSHRVSRGCSWSRTSAAMCTALSQHFKLPWQVFLVLLPLKFRSGRTTWQSNEPKWFNMHMRAIFVGQPLQALLGNALAEILSSRVRGCRYHGGPFSSGFFDVKRFGFVYMFVWNLFGSG